LLCPSDLGTGAIKNEPGFAAPGAFTQVPASNYLGIFSGLNDWHNYKLTGNGDPSSDGSPGSNPVPTMRATFGYYSGTRLATIEDGTANTMAVAEYLTGIDSNDERGGFITNRAGCQFLYVTLGPNSAAGDNILSWNPSFCPTDNSHNLPALNLPCTPGNTDANFASPRSRHSGGIQAVFCDGSVHFIADEVDIQTWQSLGWINDGQQLGTY
jgi:prepilin-type processing-associated H-X9-DG protein